MTKNIFVNSFQKVFLVGLTATIILSGFFIAPAFVDATITSLDLTAPNGTEEWRGTQTIIWDATTILGGSNNISIVLSIDSGLNYNTLIATGIDATLETFSWDTHTTAVGPLSDGNTYRIRINEGLAGLDSSSADFTVDNTRPTTTYAINPAFPDGINGWYVSVPTITLTCSDGAIGSGCNKTYYKWDNTGDWIDNSITPVTALEGDHTLYYYSDDQAIDAFVAHNEEIVQTKIIKVDTAFPTVVVTSTTANGSYNVPDAINVTLTFSEPVSSTAPLTVTLDTLGTCSVPVLTNATTGNCTYTVGVEQNSLDLTVSSIAPVSGVVEDVAGNDSTLSPTSNIANTSDIIIDTTSPIAFTVGTVAVTGGTVVSGWWNSTNTGVNVDVPVDNDASLTGGTIQLQAEADGTYENVGPAYEIFVTYLGTNILFSLSAADLEAIAVFSDGDNLQFKAVITDFAGNSTTGTESADNFDVDQTLPSVNAGIDKEVNAIVSQDATVSDGGSGIQTYAWSQTTGGGVITFSNQTGTTPTIDPDTNISSPSPDDTYILQLTITDVAGNVASDTIQFAWDTTAPVITEITPVKNPTNDTTPSYVFNVDSVKQLTASIGGTITYAGSCNNGDLSSAVAGNNTTTYGPLGDAIYSDCTIVITDAAGNSNTAFLISSFEIDTITALVVISKTYDTDLDGRIDKAEITFNDELDDSTFSPSNYTIGGVVADGFSTGATPNDAEIIIMVSAGVAGTEAKSVAYTQGSATDLAGNVIASYSQTSTDLAGPVLLSAETKTTTTINTVWSEDLDGGTVNPSGNEFAVTGFLVSAASETSVGVVTLTVATMPTDATPLITFTSAFFRDLNGQGAPSPQSTTATDGVAPVLLTVSIASNNANPIYAMEGDTVTLSFTSSEEIETPEVIIQGASATTITDLGGGTSWIASRAMLVGDTQGPVTFSIDFEDVSPAENAGITVTVVTDGSSVFFDSVNPLVNAGTDKEVNAVANQDATVSDPAPSSGGLIYAWSQQSGPGTITFGTPAAEDTTISADTDGTYIIRLTVTDNAGNVTFDEPTFIWDTTAPEFMTSNPSNGSTGIFTSAGTFTVTFNEDIVLLNSSKISLVNNLTGDSYSNGTTAVLGGNGMSAVLNIGYSELTYGTQYRINILKPNALSDVAGNKIDESRTLYFTTKIDTVVPVVNSSSAGSITTTGATLYVTTDENANCGYAVTDSEYSSMTTFMTTGTVSHYTAVSGLAPSTGYDFYIRCADTSPQTNTMTTSAHISFTTLTPDTTPPAIGNIQVSVSDTTATITWTTDENATSRVEYGLTSGPVYGSFTASDPTADNTSHSVALSGLTPGTTYHFRVLSTDASLNAGVSGDNTFTTTDTTAPEIPMFTTASATIDANTYTLAGTVGDDGGNRTINVYNGATLAGTTVVPAGLTTWSILVPLTQDAPNVFTATASDGAGNTSLPGFSITITEDTTVGDIVSPPNPVVTTSPATVDADIYTIEGTAGADLPTDGSRTITIYNNGVVMGSVVLLTGQINWSFVVSLNQNTTNTFTAYSTDESGNTSGVSNSVIITEATVADTTAPVISSVQTNPIGITTATIAWTTDEPSTSQVEYGLTSVYESGSTISDATLLTSHSVIITGLDSNTVYHFRVKSKDALLNEGVSDDNTFKTLVDDSIAGLKVTNISAVNTYATADDTYANGWSWTFYVTVPIAETDLQMKFADWTSSLNTIGVANNIQYSSAQASNGPIEITAANTYGDVLNLTADLDPLTAGRQIEVLVEAKIPVGSAGGSYSTSYGVQSN